MINPDEIAHPIDIRGEFLREFKDQVRLDAHVTTWSAFSLISGATTYSDLTLKVSLRDTFETVQEQHIPLSQELLKEKTPYEY